jgi:hypothetical protein
LIIERKDFVQNRQFFRQRVVLNVELVKCSGKMSWNRYQRMQEQQ